MVAKGSFFHRTPRPFWYFVAARTCHYFLREKRGRTNEERGREEKKGVTGERLKGDVHGVVAARLLLSQRSDNYGGRAAPRKRHALSFVEPFVRETRVCV